MKISKKIFDALVAVFIVICGVFISLGLLLDETNTILAFGFVLIALVINWSANK